MKLLIASDIHGSAYYTRELLKRFEEERADKMLLLGDILYHGPRNELPSEYSPKDVAEMLNFHRESIIAVRGNCDSEVDQMVLGFPIMADYAMLFLDGHTVFATHGHLYNEEQMPPISEGDILVYGHFHVPMYEDVDGRTVINPGSVSIPKENSKHSYMIYENGEFIWKDIDGSEIKKVKI